VKQAAEKAAGQIRARYRRSPPKCPP
jgi:hypothetical protein